MSIPREPLSLDELRHMWRATIAGTPERRALEEIARLHGVISGTRRDLSVIEAAFLELNAGRLTAIHIACGDRATPADIAPSGPPNMTPTRRNLFC